MNQKVRIWDIVLIAALLAVCFGAVFFTRTPGTVATVRVDGRIVATLPLSEDAVLPLEDGTRVIVENGSVRISDATCPDLLCEACGSVSRRGQSILCLPNRISIEISDGEVDAYVG